MKTEFGVLLGQRLRTIREAKGMLQQEVAVLMKLNRTTYCKMETGSICPSIQDADRLATVFKVKFSWLVFGRFEETKRRGPYITKKSKESRP